MAREHADDALRRADPRRPRRADHLRAAPGRLRVRGPPQRGAPPGRLRPGRGRQALGCGRHLRVAAALGRGAGDGAARRSAARTSRPRSSRATATRWSWRGSRSPAPGLERFATEIRNLQRTEVREVEEPFGKGQKGSSAMPHKRNPITTERITGLARVLRGYSQVGLENVALWHERDISHSGAERVVLPDATIAPRLHAAPRDPHRRGHERPRRPDEGEPRADPRRAVQPAGADRAGRLREDARRGLPDRPGERPARLGRAGPSSGR